MMSRGRTAKEDPRTRLARRGVSRVLYLPLHARTGVSIRARSRWTGSSRSLSARCGGCCTSTSTRPRSARSIRGSEAAGWSGKASPSPSAARCSRNPRSRSERFGSWGEGSGRRGRTRSSRRCGSRTKSDSRTVRRPGDSSTAPTTRTSRTPTSRNEPPTGIKKAKPTPSIDGPRWIDGPAVPPMRHEQPRRIAFLPVLRRNALRPDGGRAAARRHRADLHALLADPPDPSAGHAGARSRFRRPPRGRVLPPRPRRRLLSESEPPDRSPTVVGPNRRGAAPVPASGGSHLERGRLLGPHRRDELRRCGVAVVPPPHEDPHTRGGARGERRDRVSGPALPLLPTRAQRVPTCVVRGGRAGYPPVRLHRARAALDEHETPPRVRCRAAFAAIAFKAGRG